MRSIALIMAAVAIGGEPWANAQPACPLLDEATQAKLVDYVHKKYNVSLSLPLMITPDEGVSDTCYRKLRFESRDSRRPFRLELFLSPDLRFLSNELMDSHSDPTEEQRRQEESLRKALSSGPFPSFGPAEAPVTVVVFSDLQCPYCAQLAHGLKNEVIPGASGRAKIVFRHFPLPMHAWARPAAEAIQCVAQQDNAAFWRIHDYVFDHQKELSTENVGARIMIAAQDIAGFDKAKLEACVASREASAAVDRDISLAREIGVNATPTLFINGRKIVGYRPEQLLTLIRELAGSESSSPKAAN